MVTPAWELDSSSCGLAGVAVSSRNSSSWTAGGMASSSSSSSSKAVAITNISPTFLCRGNKISTICDATSSEAPLVGSNAFAHRHDIHTSVESQSRGLESRGTAGERLVVRRITCPSERTDGCRTQVFAMRKEQTLGQHLWGATVV